MGTARFTAALLGLAIAGRTAPAQTTEGFSGRAGLSRQVGAAVNPELDVPVTRNRQNPEERATVGTSALQTVAGLAGGFVLGLMGYKLAEGIADDRTVKGDAGYSPAGNWGWIAGSSLGIWGGIYGVGSALGYRASPLATGIGVAIPAALYLAIGDDPYLPLYGIVLVMPLQTVGGLTGNLLSQSRGNP